MWGENLGAPHERELFIWTNNSQAETIDANDKHWMDHQKCLVTLAARRAAINFHTAG